MQTRFPKYLYKYYSLASDNSMDYKLDTLRDGMFWMSRKDEFNDPTEFSLYKNDLSDVFQFITSTLYSFYYVTCFSKKLFNLPMWAHYTNNHKGFCVKFRVYNPNENIFKVNYIKRAELLSKIMSSATGYAELIEWSEHVTKFMTAPKLEGIENFHQWASDNRDKMSECVSAYMKILTLKMDDWAYEKEYRIILPDGMSDYIMGDDTPLMNDNLLPFEHSFLEPEAMYTGMYCSRENEEKLKGICKAWGIDKPYRMEIKDFINNRIE